MSDLDTSALPSGTLGWNGFLKAIEDGSKVAGRGVARPIAGDLPFRGCGSPAGPDDRRRGLAAYVPPLKDKRGYRPGSGLDHPEACLRRRSEVLVSSTSRGTSRKQTSVAGTKTRTKAEKRMLKVITQRGGAKRFTVLPSAETGLQNYGKVAKSATGHKH